LLLQPLLLLLLLLLLFVAASAWRQPNRELLNRTRAVLAMIRPRPKSAQQHA
jgi:hypothetical protein